MAVTNFNLIIKNTLALYVRMAFSMLVALYTSRVVLNQLGVTDFGIYGVVGGIVGLLGFLNSAMSMGTQRFLNFEMGQNNHTELKRIFSMSLSIHILIALIVFILAETVGLWFLNTQMSIPQDRIVAANWVYQFSTLSAMITLTQVPYTATIIAHERMKVYAAIGIIDVFLRLGIAIIISFTLSDKLILYAGLLFCVVLIITIIYRIYCKLKFDECSYKFYFEKHLFKKLTSFSAWNIIGSLTIIAKSQGQNILLNIFFGPVVNAAQGIAFQVNTAVSTLVANFQVAVNPQITKSYSAKDYNSYYSLIFGSAKLSFFLLLILIIPMQFELPYILSIWLGIVPDYTIIFSRLVLIATLINSYSLPLSTAAMATGNIKKYQLCVGFLELTNLPLSYFFLKLGYSPVTVFVIVIVILVLSLQMRLYLLKKIVQLSIRGFYSVVIFKTVIVTLVSLFIVFILKQFIPESPIALILFFISSICITLGVIFLIGITAKERIIITEFVTKAITKAIKKT